MNIQYENEEEQTLIGSYKISGYEDIELQEIKPKQPTQETPNSQSEQTFFKESEHEIVHTIEYGDTLEGLSLTYDVPISKIKQRNKIDSDTIYYLKEIIIPNPNAIEVVSREQQEFMKVEEFMQYMSPSEKESKAARYYLSESEWDVQKAVKEYRQDLEWEKNNNIKLTETPISQFNPKEVLKNMDKKNV